MTMNQMTATMPTTPIPVADAIWALIAKQSKATQKTLAQRLDMLLGYTSTHKTGMDRAIEDIKKGRVYEASSVEDLISQCKQ